MMQIMKASPKMEVWKTNLNFCQKGMLCLYRSLQMCEFKTGFFNFHSECKMFHHGESRWVQISCLVLIVCFFSPPFKLTSMVGVESMNFGFSFGKFKDLREW